MTLSPPYSKKLTLLGLYSLGTGTSVAITGTWQAAPPQKEQPYELKAKAVKIVGAVDAEVGHPHWIDLQYLPGGF